MISTRFDYLQFTFRFSNTVDLSHGLDRLSRFLTPSDEWYLLNHGFYSGEFWSVGFQSVRGFRGGYRWDRELQAFKGILFIGGEFLASLSFDQEYRLIKLCRRLGVNFTRVDIALDDWSRRVDPSAVVRAGEDGRYQFFNKFDLRMSKVCKSAPKVPTCYFGSEQSDKRLRFYDCEVVHGFLADRWELQLRRDYASAAIDEYLADPSCLPSLVLGSINFVDSSGVSSASDLTVCRWWASLLSEVESTKKLSVVRKSPQLERIFTWLEKQVAPSLAVLSEGLEPETFEAYIRYLVENGSARFKPFHESFVTILQKSNDSDLMNSEV